MKVLLELFCRLAGRTVPITVVATLLWASPAALQAQTWHIGDVITNSDGSKGIVFYLKADGSGGWMCALQDVSAGCAWGTNNDIPALNNIDPSYYQQCLSDTDGYGNTWKIRAYQSNDSAYAAGKVDFAGGWYLPAVGQLRRLYAALPDIEIALLNAGGTMPGAGIYWTGTENSFDTAWGINFSYGYFNPTVKTSLCAVRAIRDFTSQSILYDTTLTYQWNTGDTLPHLHVSPAATTPYTVTATTGFGCSNTATQTVIVEQSVQQTLYDTICRGEPYAANGFNIAASETQAGGTTLQRSLTLAGTHCSTIVNLQLYIRPAPETSFTATACENEGYNWNGITCYTAGDHTQTFSTRHGCDSTVTLHLAITPSSTHAFTATACNSYTWDGTTYYTSGRYIKYYTNAAGCDSTVTLHLTINHPVSIEPETVIACEEYEWHGETYTESGTYTYTREGALGECDTTETLHLTVNRAYYTEDRDTVCRDSLYQYHGIRIFTGAIGVNDTTLRYVTVAGCDSLFHLLLTVRSCAAGEWEATACDSFRWNDSTYYVSGDYVQTFVTVAGDSTETLHLTVNHPVNIDPETVTACEEYEWHGTTYNASGNYTFTREGAGGECDTTETLQLTINHDSEPTEFDATANGTYTWNGQVYTKSGDYTQTLTNAAGCDSVVTLHLTIFHDSEVTEFEATACQTYTWNGQHYVESGTYTQTFTNVEGGDSTVVLHLTINQPVNIEAEVVTACEEYEWHGETYNASDTYTYTREGANGECDTTEMLQLTINHDSEPTEFDATANGTYTWNGQVYTQSGDYTQTLINAAGCDSVVTLHLTIFHDSEVTEFEATACQTYTWNGQHYVESGTHTQTFTNVEGGDSTVVLHLTINHPVSIEAEVVAACEKYEWHGETYTESGNHTYTREGINGECDTTEMLQLTINHDSEPTEFDATANGTYTWNGQVYTQSGDYTQTLINAAGCDSVVTLHLTIFHDSEVTEFEAAACQTYTWNGQHYVESGTYTQTFTNVEGGDSTVVLHLTINHPVSIEAEVVAACEEYEWHGEMYNASDTYTHLRPGNVALGECDTNETLHLTINQPVSIDPEVVAACEEYEWHGETYTESGNHTYTREGINGECDTTEMLYLTVNLAYYTEDRDTVCRDSLYQYHGIRIFTGSIGVNDTMLRYVTVAGCDSLFHLLLTVRSCAAGEWEATACDSFRWNDSTYYVSGDYVQTFVTAAGDSTETLHLTVNHPVSIEPETVIACEEYVWHGETYTESGNHTYTCEGINGECDTTETLQLTINHPVSIEPETVAACEEYEWHGETYTESGNHTYTREGINGECDTTETLHLTVNRAYYTEDRDTVCRDSLYQYHGIRIFTGAIGVNDTMLRYGTVAGCDSLFHLLLTVRSCAGGEWEATACDSFRWNDSTYYVSGDYVQTFVTAAGDSTETLHLTVNQPVNIEPETVTACEEYEWHGITYSESGNYTFTRPGINGECDTTETLHLTVNRAYYTEDRDTVCRDSLYQYHGIRIFTGAIGVNDTMLRYVTVAGCDSLFHLLLTVRSCVAGEWEATACDSFRWNDSTYYVSGDYVQTFVTAAGDSTETLHLTVNPSFHLPNRICGETRPCENEIYTYSLPDTVDLTTFRWMVPDNARIVSGKGTRAIDLYFTGHEPAMLYLLGENGCGSSSFPLDITPRPVYHLLFVDTVCSGNEYHGNGFDLPRQDSTGYYTFVNRYHTVSGCDSVCTLALWVTATPEIDILAQPDVLCSGEEADLYATGRGETFITGGCIPPAIAIGDILCADNCIVKPNAYQGSGKTAIGIVFYLDNTGAHGWAAALHDCCTQCRWGPHSSSVQYTFSDDVPDIANYTSARKAISDVDGMTNTTALLNHYGSDFVKCQAAYMAYYWDHITNSVGTEHKRWYLPAVGQLRHLYTEIYPVNTALSLAGGTQISINQYFWYWSSSEYSYKDAYVVSHNGYVNFNYKGSYGNNFRVRAVCAF